MLRLLVSPRPNAVHLPEKKETGEKSDGAAVLHEVWKNLPCHSIVVSLCTNKKVNEKEKLVCRTGPPCGEQDVPQHCGRPMAIKGSQRDPQLRRHPAAAFREFDSRPRWRELFRNVILLHDFFRVDVDVPECLVNTIFIFVGKAHPVIARRPKDVEILT